MLTVSSIYPLPALALLDINETGDIGLWTNADSLDDPFMEFVFSGPKTYGLHTMGKPLCMKSKGFSCNYLNLFTYHKFLCSETTSHCPFKRNGKEALLDQSRINLGKVMNMSYDKRLKVNPQCKFEEVITVNILPFGYIDLDM